MNKAIIDNKQTTEKLRGMYENMHSKMGDLKSDIDTFVLYYRNITTMLRARGKVLTESDEITSLFKSFTHVKDDVFREYMKRKKEAHEEDDKVFSPSTSSSSLLKTSTTSEPNPTRMCGARRPNRSKRSSPSRPRS